MLQAKEFINRLLLVVVLAAAGLPALAAEVPLPVVTAESEAFEVVGRLEAEGLILHVDRAPSNEPVLAATLEIEADGRSVTAVFRPVSGDYLIADGAWLAPLRQAGEHALALTLIAGEDSDLLSGELIVAAAPAAAVASGGRLGLVLLALLLVVIIVVGRRLRRLPGEGA